MLQATSKLFTRTPSILSLPLYRASRISRNQLNCKMTTMTATPILAKDATAPIGPYSQAMRTVAGTPLIFVSGQLHADREGNLLEGTIAEQTAYCLKNAKAILEAGGSSLDKVIKTTIFITDMDHFKELNGEYEKWFSGEVKPARSCVAVKTLPKNARVEIEVIAQG